MNRRQFFWGVLGAFVGLRRSGGQSLTALVRARADLTPIIPRSIYGGQMDGSYSISITAYRTVTGCVAPNRS